uniref:Proton-coupled amino acid transporter 1 n=2 Tax=Lygus hesperus TaxID=30085 RepID=A0A146M9Q3_LYGHE
MSTNKIGLDPGSNQSLSINNTSSTIELVKCSSSKEKEIESQQDAHPEKVHPTSDLDALLHVVKSSLGTGVLAIADGFRNAGMVVGLVGTIIVGILCAHCTYVMVKCSQEMCKQLNRPFLGYTETVEVTMLHCANKKFSKYAGLIKKSVEGFMFFTYYGVNTVYIILVAESLQEIMENHLHLNWDIRLYILMVAIPIYLVGIVRNMKYLVPFSALANILLFFGLCLTFYYMAQDLPPIDSRPAAAPISKLPLFFSTVLFGMEGIGTMLPIENSMKTPRHFLGCPGVLNIAMSIVVTLFILLGFFGYLKFGENTRGSITLNLPQDALAETVKGLVALAILFSYGLQLAASIDVIWKRVEHRFSKENERGYYIVRSVMILGTVILAIAVPNLSPVISLIGAIGFSMCGFFYPAICETVQRWDEVGLTSFMMWKNIALIIVTIVAMVSGTLTSLSEIIEKYQ